MAEKSFLLDCRSRASGKFWTQVQIAADEVVKNPDVNFRFHSPDPKFGERFMKALEEELEKRGALYSEMSKLQQEDNK